MDPQFLIITLLSGPIKPRHMSAQHVSNIYKIYQTYVKQIKKQDKSQCTECNEFYVQTGKGESGKAWYVILAMR